MLRAARVVGRAGGVAELIVPDATALSSFGDDLLAWVRDGAITEAGVAQGRREAARIRTLWQ